MSFRILNSRGIDGLVSERLTFFVAREADRQPLLHIHRENFQNDYIKSAWSIRPQLVTETMCDRFINRKIDLNELFYKNDEKEFQSLFFGIREKKTEKLIGALEVYYVDREKCELGIFVSASYKNNGYATEITKAFIEFAKKYTNIEFIMFSVRMDNVASLRVAEKCGFEKSHVYQLYPGCEAKEFEMCIRLGEQNPTL